MGHKKYKNPEIAEILNIQIGTLRAMMQTLFRWYKVNTKEQLLGEFLCADKVQKEVDIMLSDTGNVFGG